MTKKQLLEYTREFRAGLLASRCGNPDNMCHAVCAPLQSLLEMQGVECRLVAGDVLDGWGHYWIELRGGTVLDPTASQFRRPNGRAMPRIYYGARPEWYSEYQTEKISLVDARSVFKDYLEGGYPRPSFVNQLNQVVERCLAEKRT